jgi:hypothetical protein
MEEFPTKNNETKSFGYEDLDAAFRYLRNNKSARGIVNAYLELLRAVEHELDVSRYRAEFPDLAKAARAGEMESAFLWLEEGVQELEQQGKQGKDVNQIGSRTFAASDALMEAAELGIDTSEFETKYLELEKRINKLRSIRDPI